MSAINHNHNHNVDLTRIWTYSENIEGRMHPISSVSPSSDGKFPLLCKHSLSLASLVLWSQMKAEVTCVLGKESLLGSNMLCCSCLCLARCQARTFPLERSDIGPLYCVFVPHPGIYSLSHERNAD